MRDQIMNCDAHSSKEQRACVARGARFQMRAAHAAALEASIGERIYTGLFKSSYVGRGGVEPRVSPDPNPTVEAATCAAGGCAPTALSPVIDVESHFAIRSLQCDV